VLAAATGVVHSENLTCPSFSLSEGEILDLTPIIPCGPIRTLVCHAMWASGLDAMRRWFVKPWRRRALQTLTGVALIALAISVAL
jgi:hypothetical protein